MRRAARGGGSGAVAAGAGSAERGRRPGSARRRERRKSRQQGEPLRRPEEAPPPAEVSATGGVSPASPAGRAAAAPGPARRPRCGSTALPCPALPRAQSLRAGGLPPRQWKIPEQGGQGAQPAPARPLSNATMPWPEAPGVGAHLRGWAVLQKP